MTLNENNTHYFLNMKLLSKNMMWIQQKFTLLRIVIHQGNTSFIYSHYLYLCGVKTDAEE